MQALASQKFGRANLNDLYDLAEEKDVDEGQSAYPRYKQVMRRFAEFYGAGFVPTVEAFVALSPNNDYHGNLRSLASALEAWRNGREDFTVSTYNACGRRALSYLKGEVSFLDTVSGLKIRAFRHNILYPESSSEVTVDGHIVAAWQGASLMTMKQAAAVLKNKSNYLQIASGVRNLARQRGILPSSAQATLWITRKRLNGIKMPSQYDLFYGVSDLAKTNCRPEDFPPFSKSESS